MKTIQAWIAKDMDDTTWLFLSKPIRGKAQWLTSACRYLYRLDNSDYPDIKWADKEPTEVEITIKAKQYENN